MRLAYHLSIVANQFMPQEQFEQAVFESLGNYKDVIKPHRDKKRVTELGESDMYWPATQDAEKYRIFGADFIKSPNRLLFQMVVCVEQEDHGYIDGLKKSLRKFKHNRVQKATKREWTDMNIDCLD